MPISPPISLIVPAYNEARSIHSTIEAIQPYLDRQPYRYEIIVSADGDDGTRDYALHYLEQFNTKLASENSLISR